MIKFSVTIEGASYPLIYEGESQIMGFEATRVVKAKNRTAAEIKALQLISADRKLKSMMDESVDIKPTVIISNVQKAPWWAIPGGKGFTFHRMF